MNCPQVLRRLHEIERAIGVLDFISIKKMIIETEDYILNSQKESVQTARVNETRVAVSR